MNSADSALALAAYNSVTRDGPGGAILTPRTLAEHQAVYGSKLVPDYSWPCQEAAGSLIDVVQGVALAPFGAPGYRQAGPSGWTSFFTSCTDGTATQGFGAAVNIGHNVAAQSLVSYLLFRATSQSTSRIILMLSGTNEFVGISASGHLTMTPGAGGSVSYNDGAVHPLLVELLGGVGMTNHTGIGLWRISTDKEQLTGAWLQKIDNTKGIGNAGFGGATLPPTMLVQGPDEWIGFKAETLSSSWGPKQMLQRRGWPVTGY